MRVSLTSCIEGLSAVGALARCAAVLSGYVGKAEMGEAISRAVAAVRSASPGAVYACDPVIGDEGKGVYVAPGVAEFFRDSAINLANIATPNAFELEYLTGVAPRDVISARAALEALRSRGPEVVVATSLKLDDTPDDAVDLAVADGSGAWRLRTPKVPVAVNGAGDLLSALFLAHWLKSREAPRALASAATSVYGVVMATFAAGQRELQIVEAQQEIAAPRRRFPTEPL